MQDCTSYPEAFAFGMGEKMVDRHYRVADEYFTCGPSTPLIARLPEGGAPTVSASALEIRIHPARPQWRQSQLPEPVRPESGQYHPIRTLMHSTQNRETANRAACRHQKGRAMRVEESERELLCFCRFHVRAQRTCHRSSDKSALDKNRTRHEQEHRGLAGSERSTRSTAGIPSTRKSALPSEIARRPGLTAEVANRAKETGRIPLLPSTNRMHLPADAGHPASARSGSGKGSTETTKSGRLSSAMGPFRTASGDEQTLKTNRTLQTGNMTDPVGNSHE